MEFMLGLPLFENDLEKIKRIGLEGMKELKEWELVQDKETNDKINELKAMISRAFAELSDKKRKKVYDASLAKELNVAPPDFAESSDAAGEKNKKNRGGARVPRTVKTTALKHSARKSAGSTANNGAESTIPKTKSGAKCGSFAPVPSDDGDRLHQSLMERFSSIANSDKPERQRSVSENLRAYE